MKLFIALALVIQLVNAVPVTYSPEIALNVTGSEPPCCQGACKTPGEEKYWSIAASIFGTKHCGECCMNPKDYKLYHFFEKNLTKADSDSPCKVRGYPKYDSTVTHGFGPVKMTLDLYDLGKPSPPGPTPPGPSPPAGHCGANEYCCPDAKKCLLPTETSCAKDANACGKGEICCPLTKICVVPRQPCDTPCAGAGFYCCPVTKHCVAPTNPGVFCRDSGPTKCASDEACCPTTKLCVKLGATCTPPLSFLK